MCETPLAEASKYPVTAPENVLISAVGKTQEEGMMQNRSSFPLITKPRLSDPVGLGEGLARSQRCHLPIIDVDLHTITNKLLCPNKTERLSISPACQTQRIKCVDVKYDEDEI